MAINFDEIWTNVKKNALGAKDLASLKLKLTKRGSASRRAVPCARRKCLRSTYKAGG